MNNYILNNNDYMLEKNVKTGVVFLYYIKLLSQITIHNIT